VPLLKAERVSKSYPGVQALADVAFDIDPGEVHALLGENGAGKSTLMKVLAGSVMPDSGSLTVDGVDLPLGSLEAARDKGVAIVYQELSLVPPLSVAENVMLGHWPTGRAGLIDWDALHEQAREHLEQIGLTVDSNARVRSLGMAERQLVEVAKALSNNAKVLLLDEPTSALSERESTHLFERIRDLKSSGVGIVYVSHRLSEVLDIADRITVLRDGRTVATIGAHEVAETDLAQMMVGREVEAAPSASTRSTDTSDGKVLLEATGLGRPPRLKAVALKIHAGEIVGVFGLVGAGRTRLARTLFGLEPATEGTLWIMGEPVTVASPADAIARGLGYLGEDRSMGIIPRMRVAENITLASLEEISRGVAIDFSKERELAGRYVNELAIRTPSLDRLAMTLSGGNQQKVVLARWLCSNSHVLILDDPTRGIDVGAKEEVFKLVRRLAEGGMGILYMTSEIREARALSHRLLVMAGGRVVGSVKPTSPEDEIMALAGGAHG
jgi:ABC-type sugar transport system ATPase subunit